MVRRAATRGFVTFELIVAIGLLGAAMIPLSFAILHERQVTRAYFHRAVAMEIIDGEMEVLLAESRTNLPLGRRDFTVRAESAKCLPPGKFLLSHAEMTLRLEWLPEKRGEGGKVWREVRLK